MTSSKPTLMPLGDAAILIKFSEVLEVEANLAAITLAQHLKANLPTGVLEITPNLVSVLIRYNSSTCSYNDLTGELQLLISSHDDAKPDLGGSFDIDVQFGGEGGPDLDEVASSLGVSPPAFVEAHNRLPLRVLATGFAPGFVYCGMHADDLNLPRRKEVRNLVPAGTILFAAKQTAITATAIPTGWHVIGRTSFSNFEPQNAAPTILNPGDTITFRSGLE